MTLEYYTLILIVCKCVSEENCGDTLYKVGYMTRNGIEYFSENVYPHIEEAIKNGTEYAKNSISSLCKNAYTSYANGQQQHDHPFISNQLAYKQLFPAQSVVVDGEEFVLT